MYYPPRLNSPELHNSNHQRLNRFDRAYYKGNLLAEAHFSDEITFTLRPCILEKILTILSLCSTNRGKFTKSLK